MHEVTNITVAAGAAGAEGLLLVMAATAAAALAVATPVGARRWGRVGVLGVTGPARMQFHASICPAFHSIHLQQRLLRLRDASNGNLLMDPQQQQQSPHLARQPIIPKTDLACEACAGCGVMSSCVRCCHHRPVSLVVIAGGERSVSILPPLACSPRCTVESCSASEDLQFQGLES